MADRSMWIPNLRCTKCAGSSTFTMDVIANIDIADYDLEVVHFHVLDKVREPERLVHNVIHTTVVKILLFIASEHENPAQESFLAGNPNRLTPIELWHEVV